MRTAKSGRNFLGALDRDLKPLEHFDAAMRRTHQHVGLSVRDLLDRCIELRDRRPQLTLLEQERLPDYAPWCRHRDQIEQFANRVHEIQRDGILAHHPLHLASPRLAAEDRPLELLTSSIRAAENRRASLDHVLSRSAVPRDQWEQLDRARQLIEYGKRVRPVSCLGQMALLNPKSQRAGQFTKAVKKYRKQQKLVDKTSAANKAWKQRIPADEVPIALAQARLFESGIFPWLKPAMVASAQRAQSHVRLSVSRRAPQLDSGAQGAGERILAHA